jgi:preprotein translocase subunit YajC
MADIIAAIINVLPMIILAAILVFFVFAMRKSQKRNLDEVRKQTAALERIATAFEKTR